MEYHGQATSARGPQGGPRAPLEKAWYRLCFYTQKQTHITLKQACTSQKAGRAKLST